MWDFYKEDKHLSENIKTGIPVNTIYNSVNKDVKLCLRIPAFVDEC